MKKNEKIIGIDPGYDRVGWAVGQYEGGKITLLSQGCIESNPQDEYVNRLAFIQHELVAILRQWHPTLGVIESLFFASNQKTAIKVAQARGVLLGVLLAQNIPISEFTPLQIKQAVTGSGRADKKAMAKMISLQCKLPEEKLLDDTLDAIGMIITLASRKVPV